MIRTRRRSLLGYALGATTLGCASLKSGVATSAPVTRPPGQQIPADLDLVVRIDIAKIRRRLDLAGAEALARLFISPARDPGELLIKAIACSEKIWVGLRPELEPRLWDSVTILEGDFSSITTDELVSVWGPSSDLGGGYKRYDALVREGRSAPARLYTLYDERWLIASEAEVDALERCLEEGRAERVDEPPARGLVSVTARLGRLAELGGDRAATRAFSGAQELDASFDLTESRVKVSARLRFLEEKDANLGERALSLMAGLALPKQIEWDVSRANRELSIEASAPLDVLLSRL